MFCFDRFLPLFAFASKSFSFWVLLGERAFWRSAAVAYVIIDALHMLKLNQSGFIILITLMLLIRIVWSFVWRKFSSVGREEWCNEMKYGQKLKLGDEHVTLKNIQEVQASKLGDAQGIPIFINKVSGYLSMRYIFIASYDMCYSWSVIYFCFQFVLFCLL